MSFQLTKEQLMIQKMAREFARKELEDTAEERDKNKEYPKKILKKMGELGLLGMLVPEEYDGEDMGTVSYALALSEIAYSCASTAVIMSVHNSIGCGAIKKFGTDKQKEKYLKPMARGEIIASFALTEPEAGSDPVSMVMTAKKEGDNYILNGTKRFITGGLTSEVFIIVAKTDAEARHKGITAFLLEKNIEGFSVGNIEDKMGLRGSDTTDLLFDNCKVPASALLGKEGEGFSVAMSGLEDGRIGIASQSYGVAKAAFDEACKYAKQRKQFGVSIAKFQGLRFMISEMATKLEAARLLILNAASMKDRGEKCAKEASMAKLYASELANEICGKAIQIHGGYGFSKEYKVERLYRDCRIFTIYEGTSEVQKIVIANEVLRDKKK